MIINVDNANLYEIGFMESPVAQLMLSHRRIVAANRALADLFGHAPESLAGHSVRRLYPSLEDYAAIGDHCEAWLRSHRSYEDQRLMQGAHGEIFWTRARGVTLTQEIPSG